MIICSTRGISRAPRPVTRRPVVVADLLNACDAASELIARGRDAYDNHRMLRLAAEAILGRIGDASTKLCNQVGDELPGDIPWDEVIANRIVVDHGYHRVGYVALWNTLQRDVPSSRRVAAWVQERGLGNTIT